MTPDRRLQSMPIRQKDSWGSRQVQTAEQITDFVEANTEYWIQELRRTQADLQGLYFDRKEDFLGFVGQLPRNKDSDQKPQRVIHTLDSQEKLERVSESHILDMGGDGIVSITSHNGIDMLVPGGRVDVAPLSGGNPLFRSTFSVPQFYSLDSYKMISEGSFEVNRLQGDIEIAGRPFMVDAVTTELSIKLPSQNGDLLIGHTISSAVPGTILPGFSEAIFYDPEEEKSRTQITDTLSQSAYQARKFQYSPLARMMNVDSSIANIYTLKPSEIKDVLSSSASYIEPFENLVQYGYSFLSVHGKWVKSRVYINPWNSKLSLGITLPTQHKNGWEEERPVMGIVVSGIPGDLAHNDPKPVSIFKADEKPVVQKSMREMVIEGFKNAKLMTA